MKLSSCLVFIPLLIEGSRARFTFILVRCSPLVPPNANQALVFSRILENNLIRSRDMVRRPILMVIVRACVCRVTLTGSLCKILTS